MNFERKGYGRIFVDKEENIARVKEIIKEMDEYEYGYLPDDLITVYDTTCYKIHSDGSISTASTTYNHKFDSLDLGELMFRCWNEGIHIFCLIGRYGYSKILDQEMRL